MKKPVFDKPIVKWAFAWFVVCCLFSLLSFAADLSIVSFQQYLKNSTDNSLLTMTDWNGVMTALEGFQSNVISEMHKYKIPVGTIIMFDGACPAEDWWTEWTVWWDRFIMPANGWWAGDIWWETWFTLTVDQLPEHSHLMFWGEGTEYLSQASVIWVANSLKVWDNDYFLLWSSSSHAYWVTSKVWENKPVEFTPPYIKVTFCEKTSEGS